MISTVSFKDFTKSDTNFGHFTWTVANKINPFKPPILNKFWKKMDWNFSNSRHYSTESIETLQTCIVSIKMPQDKKIVYNFLSNIVQFNSCNQWAILVSWVSQILFLTIKLVLCTTWTKKQSKQQLSNITVTWSIEYNGTNFFVLGLQSSCIRPFYFKKISF